MSNTSKRKLFICGCGHSGTSLVANIFAAHPGAFVPPDETNAFADPEKAEAEWRRLRLQWKKSGKPYIVEKTPRHVRAIDQIRAEVSGAKFLIMVRDPRAVVASIARRSGNFESAISRWVNDNTIAAAQRGRPDVYLLRYEDLIVAPAKFIGLVCHFSGIEFRPEMLNYHERPVDWFKSNAKGDLKDIRNTQINSPIFDARFNWQKDLPPEWTRAIFTEYPEVPGLMKALGYPKSVVLARIANQVRRMVPSYLFRLHRSVERKRTKWVFER